MFLEESKTLIAFHKLNSLYPYMNVFSDRDQIHRHGPKVGVRPKIGVFSRLRKVGVRLILGCAYMRGFTILHPSQDSVHDNSRNIKTIIWYGDIYMKTMVTDN